MKWVELITLRSLGNINGQFVNALLKGVRESDLPTDRLKHLVEIGVYHHSVLDTDLSIHIYWKSELGSQDKSPLGLRFSSALRPLGLLNHSVWGEIAALEFPLSNGNSKSRDILESEKGHLRKFIEKPLGKGGEENEDAPSDS